MSRGLDPAKSPLRRREALMLFGAAAGGAIWQTACGSKGSSGAAASSSSVADGTAAAAVCVLSPEVTEGPYWMANHLTRRDITDGRPGLPLALRITVVDADTCKPGSGCRLPPGGRFG
jgi:protocatechuate 3,4-dioxygenase beta subunit